MEYLRKTPLGESLALVMEYAELMAPELMDAEVTAMLRRSVQHDHLTEERALMALDDLPTWPVERISHRTLTKSVWQHRHDVGAYDAFYVAAARARRVSLLTADGRLSRAPGLGIAIHHVRLG